MTVNFQQLQDDVYTIKEMVSALIEQQSPPVPAPIEYKPLSISDAAEFLGIAEQTIYQNIKRIPHRKKFGRLYFFKDELLAYLDGKEVSHE
ncbi:helix-turn-helix domain-containing protein [Spirosoma sp.]|uniref:helix-turn-helix domain-containing protein n=1 Tax=Spirosoma sp. TaxID=1899569 RepID=UPI003B3AD0A4